MLGGNLMSKNVVIFNIGNRDLYFKEEVEILGETFTDIIQPKYDKEKKESRFREVSEYIYQHYDEFKERIHFPIIENTIESVYRYNLEKLHEIILYATNQEMKHGTDTIFIAKIIQKYINEKLRNKEKYKKVLEEAKKPKIVEITSNPSDTDLMMEFYERELEKYKDKQDGKVFLSITSGTQAMNSMLLFNAIKYLNKQAEILYLPKDGLYPNNLQVGERILKQNYIENMTDNVKNYDYYAALQFIRKRKDAFLDIKNTELFLEYAHQRFSFNFDEAEQIIKFLIDKNPKYRAKLSEFYNQLIDMMYDVDNNPRLLIAELYWNIWVLYQRGQFIDVLGRIFRFQEAILNYGLTKVLNIPISDKGIIDPKWLEDRTELNEYLSNIDTSNGKGVVVHNKPLTRLSMMSILKFYSNKMNELELLIRSTEMIEKLAELRNKTTIAHGWKGCSEYDLYTYLKEPLNLNNISELEGKFFGLLKDIYTNVFGEQKGIETNVYNKQNEYIIEFIKQLE